MYINNEDFEIWMQKLSKKLSEIGQDLKSLINTKEVFDPKKTSYKERVVRIKFIIDSDDPSLIINSNKI